MGNKALRLHFHQTELGQPGTLDPTLSLSCFLHNKKRVPFITTNCHCH
jgi:hypothetical protein